MLIRHPKQDFNKVILKEFEGYQIPVMAGYKRYLKEIWGDYMQLPPEERKAIEREFYTPIQDWPYPASFSMEDLEDKIIKYDHEIAKKRILNHHIKLGICESGMASEIVGKEIVKLCRYQ